MNCHRQKLILILVLLCFTVNPLVSFASLQIIDEKEMYGPHKNKEEAEPKEVISITSDELYLLSKLVASEARGESYEGQVAVAAVVINRVRDPRFPNSIEEVIYQKNAFSVVNNGKIYMDPTDSAYTAAKEALYGQDPTSGAIYFWNPDIATCSWIKTLDPYRRIGNHVFAR